MVDVKDLRFDGAPVPFHWKIADPTVASIIIDVIAGGQIAGAVRISVCEAVG